MLRKTALSPQKLSLPIWRTSLERSGDQKPSASRSSALMTSRNLLGLSCGDISTCRYALLMSNFDKKRTPPNLSRRESTRGIGYGSGFVRALSLRKSTQSPPEPSSLGTTQIGTDHGLNDSSIMLTLG